MREIVRRRWPANGMAGSVLGSHLLPYEPPLAFLGQHSTTALVALRPAPPKQAAAHAASMVGHSDAAAGQQDGQDLRPQPSLAQRRPCACRESDVLRAASESERGTPATNNHQLDQAHPVVCERDPGGDGRLGLPLVRMSLSASLCLCSLACAKPRGRDWPDPLVQVVGSASAATGGALGGSCRSLGRRRATDGTARPARGHPAGACFSQCLPSTQGPFCPMRDIVWRRRSADGMARSVLGSHLLPYEPPMAQPDHHSGTRLTAASAGAFRAH